LPLSAAVPGSNTASCNVNVDNQPAPVPQDNKTVISADDSSTQGNKFILDGHVIIRDQDQTIQADRVTYDQASGDAELQGNINLQHKALSIKAEQGHANTKDKTAKFSELEYELINYSAQGEAATAELHKNQTATLRDITYTTCSKPDPDWKIKADMVKLDQNNETASAENVLLRFKGVPLFYFPRFSFPTGDKRKSGFLIPSFGESSSAGTEIDIPWYWNIAPNRDATFNLRYMSDRGAQLGTEYRHLHGNNALSKVRLEYLNDDILKDDRNLISAQHNGRYFKHWKVHADLNRVSDQQYFDDLDQGFNLSSVTHLPRVVELRRDNQYGFVLARAHEFQSINSANTYQRLPQLMLDLTSSSHNDHIYYSLNSELTRFDHRNRLTSGSRLDILPGIEYNLSTPGYFLRPKLMFRHTSYRLTDQPMTQANSFSRNIPIASLDAGLIFERPVSFSGRAHTWTLEPRLYYLYAEFEDQDQLPVFDTTLPDFRLQDLFRHNRFTGPDRQSDANQVALAVNSRMIDGQTGNEWLRLGIGQVFYFEDRRVNLPGQSLASNSTSDFVGELEARLNERKRFRISGLWDTDNNQANRGIVSYQYRKDTKHHFGINYRYQRDQIEQTDVVGRWKLSSRWHALGKWAYSLRDKQTIDSLIGLEYETCCWSIQLAGRRHLDTNGIGMENALYIQLNFKGLSSVGKNIDDLLDDSKLGYISRSTVQ